MSMVAWIHYKGDAVARRTRSQSGSALPIEGIAVGLSLPLVNHQDRLQGIGKNSKAVATRSKTAKRNLALSEGVQTRQQDADQGDNLEEPGDVDPVAGSALMNSRDVERAEDVPSDADLEHLYGASWPVRYEGSELQKEVQDTLHGLETCLHRLQQSVESLDSRTQALHSRLMEGCAPGGWRHQIAIALQGDTIPSSPAVQKSNEMTNIGNTNVKLRSQNHFRSEDVPTDYVYVEGYGVVPVAPARVEQAIPRARSCVPSLNAVNGPFRDSSAAPRSHSLAQRSPYNERAVEELHNDNLPSKETASGVCPAVKNGFMGEDHSEQNDDLAHREPSEHPDIENVPDKVSTGEATESQLAQQDLRNHNTGAGVHNEATVCANLHQSVRQPIEQDGGCQSDTLNIPASPAKDQEQDDRVQKAKLPPPTSNTSPKVSAPESTGAKFSCQGLHGPSLPRRSNVRQRARKQLMAQAINSLTKRPDSSAQAPMPQTEPCGVLESSHEAYVRVPDSNGQRVEDEEQGNNMADTSKSLLLGEQPNGNASVLQSSEIPEELQEQSFPSLEPSSSVSASQLTGVQRHKRKRSSTPSSTMSPYSEEIQPMGEQQALEESQSASHETEKPPPKRRKRQKIQNKPSAVDRIDSRNVPEPNSKAKNPPRKKPVMIVVPKVKAAQPARDIASNTQGAVPDIQVPTLGSMKSFAVFHETWDKSKEGERPAMKEYLDLKIRKPGFEYRRYSEWKKLANEINRIAAEREIPGSEVAELLDCKRGNRSFYMFTDSFIHKSGATSDWL